MLAELLHFAVLAAEALGHQVLMVNLLEEILTVALAALMVVVARVVVATLLFTAVFVTTALAFLKRVLLAQYVLFIPVTQEHSHQLAQVHLNF